MSTRNIGIGHIAARSLLAEIAELREELRQHGTLLKNIEMVTTALYCDLHCINRQRLPLYTGPEE